ncbi:MAG: hypothetical protein GF317_24025 [Candidatus Lokiarchaeota archaeon]|nr:hypothetical protein [Candidatus Lokiarchaeota archaeon]MBD3202441.1 hypothetical protein [Candidatus Lokiarchaeota archaeon]
MGISDGEDLFSEEKLYKIRKNKIKNQINAAIRLLNQNIEPLEVADRFIHQSYELVKEGILHRFPHYSEEQIKEKIRDISLYSEKIKSNRKKRDGIG